MSTLTNLDPRYYVDAGVFEAERQKIFRRHWQMLGPVDQVKPPGGIDSRRACRSATY
jgi:choline monooxygenase